MRLSLFRALLVLIFLIVLLAGCSRKKSPRETREMQEPAAVAQKLQQETQAESPKWGNAPDFTLAKLGGGQFTLSSLEGKVIIVNFWATYCPPCRQEIPDFVDLYEKYREDGLEIVGVSLDRGGESAVAAFVEILHVNYTIVFGGQEVVEKYRGIEYIPTTFVIDRDGNIAKKYVGFKSKEVFEAEVKKLLAQNP